MRKQITRAVAALVFGMSSLLMATGVLADEWPLKSGDFWEVTGIDVKDGDDYKYADWLATEWRKDAEFAKSKGWIKEVFVLYNIYARADEADLYLIWIREDIPTGPEFDKRGQEYQEWKKKTFESLVGESGERAVYREVLSSSLLQHAPFRD